VGLDPRWLPVVFALTWIAAAQDERRLLVERAEHHPAREGDHVTGRRTIRPDHFLDHVRYYLRHQGEFARVMGLAEGGEQA
jgi:hypothetical protein